MWNMDSIDKNATGGRMPSLDYYDGLQADEEDTEEDRLREYVARKVKR